MAIEIFTKMSFSSLTIRAVSNQFTEAFLFVLNHFVQESFQYF